nr:retrovirus-related Pol polyprotein from transposon TNT 1-94 [Tanacetum cinerariifolium]
MYLRLGVVDGLDRMERGYQGRCLGNGIYEIDMLNLVPNVNSIYNDSHFIILRMIIVRLTPPYTPQHNGVSERRNLTLLDMVRSMMNLTTLPLSFWDYALETATRIFNMVPTKKVRKTHRAPDRLCLNVEVEERSLRNLNEPANYKAAILDPKYDKWLDAINAKMQSMKDNQVWHLVNLPPNYKTVGSK